MINPLAFYDIAVLVRDSAADALQTSPGGSPSVIGIVPGAIAWDNCECDGGQLSVTMTRIFLSDRFPTDSAATDTLKHGNLCGSALIVAEYLVQLIRCAPQPQGREIGPTAAALDTAAQINISDATILADSVSCALGNAQDANKIDAYVLRSVASVGPLGACVGSEMIIAVSLIR